jgi:hypothetical protein
MSASIISADLPGKLAFRKGLEVGALEFFTPLKIQDYYLKI